MLELHSAIFIYVVCLLEHDPPSPDQTVHN